ncbi:3-(3-hydroxy-phenyl)propionate/3-hydroxycinnamic acid hydroxylase [Ktedonobacter sp. SOSP1-52]|uniref:FAD-dependent monooxygenase n=1 Tax=Ktedonobacter sp. SOSP1-52 TaxID=2778366 RepID=UPI001915F9C4|nr:FAD-dependent monooxygenase [Ktedonobacter sp. SOSP1-52]GHO66604.1 3-(3-hydroxy-phenyl)propionate/3-hydroxycinnamic acid hydroxylase [Ktedonobacter sp. SOSP1-52]
MQEEPHLEEGSAEDDPGNHPRHAPISGKLPAYSSVIIVGAGPTGLAAANLLGLLGVSTVLIERNEELCTFPRAISIDDEGLRFCQAIGLRDALLPSMRLGTEAHYLSGPHLLARVAPTQQRNGFPLISTFHQPTFEQALLQGLARFPHVRVCFQHELLTFKQSENEVLLTLRAPGEQQIQVRCAFLLACDGGRSPIRHALALSMHTPSLSQAPLPLAARLMGPQEAVQARQAPQRWLVVDCVEDDDPANAIIFFCNPTRPAVTVPAPAQGRRWEFMLHSQEQSEDMLREERIQALIRQSRLAQRHWSAGKPAQISRKAVYTFYATMTSRLAHHRVFLLGDAAHLMPPFGGQGMNSGLRDVHNLCWKVALVLQRRAGQSILASYQGERVPHIREMILFSSTLGRIIMPTNRVVALLRDLLLRGVIARIPAFTESLREMRVKPQPRYSHGLILSTRLPGFSHIPGSYLPQPQMLTLAHQPLALDDLLGPGFSLIRLAPEEGLVEDPLQHPAWSRLKPRYITLIPRLRHVPSERLIPPHLTPAYDLDGSLHALFQGRHDLYLLVRPDRYILGVFRAGEATVFAQRLLRLLDL